MYVSFERMHYFVSRRYRTMPNVPSGWSSMLPDFDAYDEKLASKTAKIYGHSRGLAGMGAATLILLHEFCGSVPLPITGGAVSGGFGIAPLVMSNLFRAICLTEFGIKKETVPSALYFQLALIAVYVGQWSQRALGSWPAQWVALDAFILFSFATAVRYMDIVVSGFSNRWISLVHASICISQGGELLARLTTFPDCVVVAGCLLLCYFLVTRGGDSVRFLSIRHRKHGSLYEIPFMYNGPTALIYTDTMLPILTGLATFAASSATILRGAWASAILERFGGLEVFMGSAMGSLMQFAIVATLELHLPRMQGRDAHSIVGRYEGQHMTMQGWRAGENMAKRVLARKIWSVQRRALGVTLATKLLGLSGTLVVVEQLHSMPLGAALRRLPRCLRAPFAF